MKGKRKRKIIHVASEQQHIYWWLWAGIAIKELSLLIWGLKHKGEKRSAQRGWGYEETEENMTCVICGFHSLSLSLPVELLNTFLFLWSGEFSGSPYEWACVVGHAQRMYIVTRAAWVRAGFWDANREPVFMLKLALLYLYIQSLHLASWWEFMNHFLGFFWGGLQAYVCTDMDIFKTPISFLRFRIHVHIKMILVSFDVKGKSCSSIKTYWFLTKTQRQVLLNDDLVRGFSSYENPDIVYLTQF